LRAGNHVKAVVLVCGRGIEQVDLAAKLLGRLAEELAPYGTVDATQWDPSDAHILIKPRKD
jgi:translation initiation factor IF-3